MFRLECCDGFYLALIHAKASLSLKQTYLFTNKDEHKEKVKSLQQRMINSVPNRKLCLTIWEIMV